MVQTLTAAAQRLAHQPRRTHRSGKQSSRIQLSKNARSCSTRSGVGCMGGLGGGHGLVSLSRRVGWLLAWLVELEKELLNLLATCVGETLVLADNPEPTFF